MSVSNIGYGSTDTSIENELVKRDTEITKNQHAIDSLQRTYTENSEILRTMAVREEQLDERQKNLLGRVDQLDAEMQQIKKTTKSTGVQTHIASKICIVITGLVVVGLITTGIAVGVIRYG